MSPTREAVEPNGVNPMPDERAEARVEARARVAQRLVKGDQLAGEVGELRLAGLSFRQIAQALDCSLGAAHKAWGRFRKALIRDGVEDERRLMAARLERQLRQLSTRMAAGDPRAHAVAVEVNKLLAVILGLEAPRHVDLDLHARQVTVVEFGHQPTGEVSEGSRLPLLGPAEAVVSAEARS